MSKSQSVVNAFTSGQVMRITGLSYRTLDHWARTGFIAPTVAAASGTGTERLYSIKDIVALRVARKLRKQGITTRSLKRVVEKLRAAKGIEQPLAELCFVVVGKDLVTVSSSPQRVVSLLKSPDQIEFAFTVDL